MPPKRRVEAAGDKKEVPPAEKTKKEKIKETVNHSEEVAHILEDYRQGLFELLQIIAVKFDKMTDGLAETIIRDSLNEFDDRIMERKTSKQVIESLGSTDTMSGVNEKTPTVSPDQDATGGSAASQFAEIAEARMVEMAEVDETPGNFKIIDKDFKKIMEKRIISEFNKITIMKKQKTKMAKHKCFIYHFDHL